MISRGKIVKDEKYWEWVNRRQYIGQIVDLALSAYFEEGRSIMTICYRFELNYGTLSKWICEVKKLGFVEEVA